MSNYHRKLQQKTLPSRPGFSLAECAVSLLITAVVILGALNCVAFTQRTRVQLQTSRQAKDLAQQLMSEIQAAYYKDPSGTTNFGTESGELTGDRSLYNDVDDYSSFVESPPKSKSGVAIVGFTGWTRSSTVQWISPGLPTLPWFTETNSKKIVVTVLDPSGKQTSLTAIRTSKGLGEQRPLTTTTTYETWGQTDINVGAAGVTLSRGVNFVNGAN